MTNYSKMNVGEWFGIETPRVLRAIETELRSTNNLIGKPPEVHNPVGLEIEIENTEKYASAILRLHESSMTNPLLSIFSIVEDRSLRNNGIEIVSLPIDETSVKPYLVLVFNYLKSKYLKCKFSDRCGIHIHQDVTTATFEQVVNIIKMYIIFEDKIFQYAGEGRKNNTFCTAYSKFDIRKKVLTDYIIRNMNPGEYLPEEDFGKYAGLNICRLQNIGTLEYRHLPGLWNIDHITNFVKIIGCLKRYVIRDLVNPTEDLNKIIGQLNTISNYREFIYTVFGDFMYYLFPEEDYKSIEEGVTLSKLCILPEVIHKKLGIQSIINNKAFYKLLKNKLVQNDEIPNDQGGRW